MNDKIYGSLSSKKFADAAIDVIKFLNKTLGFDLWVVTRHNGDEYIVLQSENHNQYNVPAGSVFKWCDTFCSRMVSGQGPEFAANLSDIAAYTEAPFARMVPVGSYMGVPLHNPDGSVFGTLCAIHPTPREQSLESQLPMVKTFAGLLSNLMESETKATEIQREADHAAAEAMKDAVATMLYNRKGWDHLTVAEERRARDLGHNMTVISIDLNNLKTLNDTFGHAKGTEYILQAGQAMAAVLRPEDIAARVGGDEFLILLPECDLQQAATILDKLKQQFTDRQVDAAIGMAQFDHAESFENLVDRADQAMYTDKREQKAKKQA